MTLVELGSDAWKGKWKRWSSLEDSGLGRPCRINGWLSEDLGRAKTRMKEMNEMIQ